MAQTGRNFDLPRCIHRVVGDFLMGSTGVTQLRFERLMPPFRLDCTDLAGVGYDPKGATRWVLHTTRGGRALQMVPPATTGLTPFSTPELKGFNDAILAPGPTRVQVPCITVGPPGLRGVTP